MQEHHASGRRADGTPGCGLVVVRLLLMSKAGSLVPFLAEPQRGNRWTMPIPRRVGKHSCGRAALGQAICRFRAASSAFRRCRLPVSTEADLTAEVSIRSRGSDREPPSVEYDG